MAVPAGTLLRWIVLGALPWMYPLAAKAQDNSSGLVVPIAQTAMQDGSIRYSIWVRAGRRTVEAMLDTGSTGLRVLPPVIPGDLTGLPAEADYGNGVSLKGLSIPVHVEIGGLSGEVPVEVVDHAGCINSETACPVPKHGDTFLIGGDGLSGHGFSAILGIGFSNRSRDIPNPLEALGAGSWIVELPSPADPSAPGRLILKPDAATQAQFKMAPAVKGGDFFGCLQSKKPEQMICGPLLLDTGAPGILAVTQDMQTSETWPPGRPVSFRFRSGQTLSFDAGGDGDLTQVRAVPAKQHPGNGDNFILAGLLPYLFYDVLYDATDHKVGLRERGKPVAAAAPPDQAPAAAAVESPAPPAVAVKAAARPPGPKGELPVRPPQDAPN